MSVVSSKSIKRVSNSNDVADSIDNLPARRGPMFPSAYYLLVDIFYQLKGRGYLIRISVLERSYSVCGNSASCIDGLNIR